jgi:nucleotide-binding universal stress UspA family protein
MERILVAIDDSECAQRAAAMAADLGRRLGATVTLAYAVPPPPVLGEPAMVDTAALARAHDDHAQKLLDRTAAAVSRPDLRLSTQILHGPAPEALNEAAEKLRVDLVVVGSRGRNAFTRAILGSVSHALVQTSKKPVLVVH